MSEESSSSRRIWPTLRAAEIIELKQAMSGQERLDVAADRGGEVGADRHRGAQIDLRMVGRHGAQVGG